MSLLKLVTTRLQNMQNIIIQNPCPFVPTKGNKTEKGHFCKSCKKEVVDFTKMNDEEIREKLTKNTCGIFYEDQLVAQPKLSFRRQIMFSTMTVLSFLGFQIRPIQAQVQENKYEEVFIETPQEKVEEDDKTKKTETATRNKKYRRRHFFRRRRRGKPIVGRTIGCPTF